jgi:hypothetical protein
LAGILAIIAGVLFILSGYEADTRIYSFVESLFREHADSEISEIVIIPLHIVVLVAQLGGIAVIVGGVLFLKSRITAGKVLVFIGTGYGILMIILSVILGLSSEGPEFLGSYVVWLTGTASGLGILCSLIARAVAK